MSNKKTSQRQDVLKHFEEHTYLTADECWKLYGIQRLSSIIHNLRKEGYDIRTNMVEGITRHGTTCRYAKYMYVKENK